jgi:glutamyl-tRNA reductase
VPTILALRETAEVLREAELKRARKRLAAGEDPDKVLEQLARALTNKFTHTPSHTLKLANPSDSRELIQSARKLFNLDEE